MCFGGVRFMPQFGGFRPPFIGFRPPFMGFRPPFMGFRPPFMDGFRGFGFCEPRSFYYDDCCDSHHHSSSRAFFNGMLGGIVSRLGMDLIGRIAPNYWEGADCSFYGDFY